MAKKTKRTAYKFKALSGGNDHQEKLEQCYVDAFNKGYSVVQIARIAGLKSAKYIHAALVKKGCISKGKPGPQPGKIVLPEAFAAVLKIRELSFAQWCAGWSFEPIEVASMLDQPTARLEGALRRDFPGYYSKSTGVKVEDVAVGPEFEKLNFSVDFVWDGAEGCYTAEIKELGVKVCGDSWSHAFYLANTQRMGCVAMMRLEQAPNLNAAEEGEFDW